MRGEAGNGFIIKIKDPAPGTGTVSVLPAPERGISIRPQTGNDSAETVATLVNSTPEARALVSVEFGGNGTGSVFDTDIDGEPLKDGKDTDGKLIGNQNVILPRGTDTTRGEYNRETRSLVIDGYDNYAYTANSNGFYPGLGAFIAKSKADNDDPFEQGWYNAFMADADSVTARFLWYFGNFVVQAPSYKDDEISPEHGSAWMGVGTDTPESPLHLEVPGVAEARLRNTNRNTMAGDFARILLDGRGNGATSEARTMASIVGNIVNFAEGDEDARILFKVMRDGVLATRWQLSDGIPSTGVTGGNKGPATINTDSYWVGGVKALSNSNGGARLGFGAPSTATVGSGAITFRSSNMTVVAVGSAATLKTIHTDGADGDVLILRSTSTSAPVTVVDDSSGNIRCGADVDLSDGKSTLTLLRAGSEWLRIGGFEHA